MRRTVPVIAASAGALALLANFHTSPGGALPGSLALPPGTATTTPANRSTTTRPAPASGGPPTTTTTTTATGATRTVDGPVVGTEYGDVQVRVTLQGKKLVDVQALKLPNDRSRSVRISQQAGPLLRNEALQAQSANIDLLSGASYTSQGYARSLQGALDKATS